MTYKPISSEDRRAAATAFNQGIAALRAGDEARAIELWTTASQRDPSLTPAYRNLIVFFENAGDDARVIDLYGALLRENPVDTESLIRQASAYRRQGRYDEAIANYRKAISVYPYFRFWYSELGDLFHAIGDADQGDIWEKRAQDLDADAAEMAFDDGVRALRDENYPLAQACFEAILEDYPANLDARMKFARAQVGMADFEGALASYNEALTFTDVAQGLVHFTRASVLVHLDRREEAEVELELAIDYEPDYARAHRLMAQLQAGNLDASGAGAPAAHQSAGTSRPGLSKPGASRPKSSRPTSSRPSSSQPTSSRPTSSQHGSAHSRPSSSAPTSQPPSSRISGAITGRPGTQRLSPAEEPELLDMDLIEEVPSYSFVAPGSHYSWDQQLHAVFTQALAVSAPGGATPRIALLVEPVQQVAAAMTHMLAGIQHPSYGLWRKEGPSRIMVAESNPMPGPNSVRSAGWMGSGIPVGSDTSNWGPGAVAFPIDQMLDAIIERGGRDGYNLVLILATGRVSGDQASTLRRIKELRTHQMIFLRPQRHFADLGLRMQTIAPHWFEITLPF